MISSLSALPLSLPPSTPSLRTTRLSANDVQRGKRRQRDKKDLPAVAVAVLESKPHLVGTHERVRSDIEGPQPLTSVSTVSEECGVPRTYTSAKGMVCPICVDRPIAEANNETKKKGWTIKDKEKSKRMKGQSSHATWESKTEMQLRQSFD